ncbi:MAG TPA: hypothetical protein VLA13_03170 [Massilibacterium sp.]|nr:hypothetical protein [Massilibacterium sp.]
MENVKASFDIESVEGQVRLFNAKNGSGQAMKDLEHGTVLNGKGIVQYPETTDTYGHEQEVMVTVLFTEDGESFASVSESVAKAGSNLIDFLSATGQEEFKVKIIKATSKGGNEFLNLQLIG